MGSGCWIFNLISKMEDVILKKWILKMDIKNKTNTGHLFPPKTFKHQTTVLYDTLTLIKAEITLYWSN